MNRTLDTLEASGKLEGFNVEMDVVTQEILVKAVPAQIEQVLVTLVRRAIGSFSDTAEDRRLDVVVQMDDENRCATVQVGDNGPKIPENELKTIFQRGGIATSSQGGTSLRLSVIAQVVERYGGAMCGRARSKGGSEFSFALPLSQ